MLTKFLIIKKCLKSGLNFDNHSNYDELMNKTIDLAVLMRNTFKKYI